jgi:alcohol dehydrogenase class IV
MIQSVIANISSFELENLFSNYSAKKIFLVTGKSSYKLSGAEEFIDKISKEIDFIRFSDFEQNPKYEDAVKGVTLYQQSNCDIIVAIGGGSVIDMAKLINIFSANNDLDDLEIVKKSKLITKKGKLLIAIPTTAGTGSEATHFAVVYHNKKKYSVAHQFILPEVVGLNSKFTLTQPKYLTACAGLDALSQAIESYWSVGANNESKIFAKQAIELLICNLEDTVNKPNTIIRKAVMQGAYLAGKAINITKTTAPHAISYAFTTYFSIPHGHAVFLTLPQFFVANDKVTELNVNDSRGKEYVQKTMKELYDLLKVNSANEAKDLLEDLLNKIGLEKSYAKLGINGEEEIQLIMSSINTERLKNNPVNLSKEEIKTILLDSLN